MKRRSSFAGRITLEPLVNCGICEHHVYLAKSGGTSAEAARFIGFRYVKHIGWVCPDCLDSRRHLTEVGR